jgi:hypothetical protein
MLAPIHTYDNLIKYRIRKKSIKSSIGVLNLRSKVLY